MPAPNPMPRSTPIQMSDLIEVADGAIVSREVLRNAGGTVTAFAFDGGEGLSEHSAPFDALVQVVSGRLDLVIGGQQVTAEAGTVVIMPAEIPHALHAPVASVMVLTMLKEGA